jgi:hypothetical protein
MSSDPNIPNTWMCSTIGEHVRFEGGTQPPRSTFVFEERPGYIRLVQTRDFKTDNYKTYIPVTANHKTFKDNDIMIGRYGPPVFQIYRGLAGAYNVALIKASPKTTALDRDYLYYTLKQENLFTLIDSLSRRSSGQTGVDMDALKNFRLPLPPVSEQRQITEILRTWNEAIAKLEELRTLKDRRLAALRAGLLFGKLRTEGRQCKWQPRRLAEVTHELTNRNGKQALGRDMVKGVTNTKGIVPMRDQTIADDISRYKRLPPRAFAYNPMRINVGSIAMNDSEEEVPWSAQTTLYSDAAQMTSIQNTLNISARRNGGITILIAAVLAASGCEPIMRIWPRSSCLCRTLKSNGRSPAS